MMGELDGANPGTRGSSPDAAWSPEAQPAAATTTGKPTEPGVELDLPGYWDFVPVARGGESVVYRARQVGLDRLVAIKVLSPNRETRDDESRRWFQRELEITVRLGQAHPNIVTVLDTRLTGAGEPCIVMEYYELGSLHDQLRAHGPMPSNAVVAVGTVIADALAYAHDQGVLHRDVKPQNILALPTSYVLADFGLARPIATERSTSLERFSYRHAAPQVLDGELPTVADDIYSLASTLFTLLDGRPPFAAEGSESDSALAYLRRVRTEAPRTIEGTDAPAELVSIINRCLSRRREERFPDAASLREALAVITTEARMWAPSAASGAPQQLPAPPAPSGAAQQLPAPRAAGGAPQPRTVPGASPLPSPADEPGTTPATATPAAGAPLARSVIEYLERPSPTGDPLRPLWTGDGTDPDELEATGRRAEPEPEPAGPPGRPRRVTFAIRAGVALLVGGLLGLGGTWLAGANHSGEGGQPSTTTGPSGSAGRAVPNYTGPPLTPTGSAAANDPALAPTITAIDDRGNAVELHWVDHSGGRATFVIVEVKDAGASPVRLVDPGETTVVIDGLDRAATRYCYQIIAVTDKTRGVSPLRCTAPR